MQKFVKKRSIAQGFANAFAGLNWAFKSQINFKIHIFAVILVLVISLFFSISYLEWLVVITVIFTVLALELLNTSIEQTTDAVTQDFNPIIKKAKDTSAAAVLIYSIYAVLVGLLIFGPKILNNLNL
jgi:diacylglycerol kinase